MKRLWLLIVAACATKVSGLHLDLKTFQGPLRAGTPVEARLERTCAPTFHVVVTDDEHQAAPEVPVHFELDSVERCVEQTVAHHTLSTGAVLTDSKGIATTCDPDSVARDDPWSGIRGCASVFGDVRLVVGVGSKQVVKVGPFADGMTVKLRHGYEASPTSPQK